MPLFSRRMDEFHISAVYTRVLRLLIATVAVHAVFLQTNRAQADDTKESESLEEIIVNAPRPLNSMRAEILQAEDRVFQLFNEFNTNDDYDIECRHEAPVGSRIPRRVCMPKTLTTCGLEQPEIVSR